MITLFFCVYFPLHQLKPLNLKIIFNKALVRNKRTHNEDIIEWWSRFLYLYELILKHLCIPLSMHSITVHKKSMESIYHKFFNRRQAYFLANFYKMTFKIIKIVENKSKIKQF